MTNSNDECLAHKKKKGNHFAAIGSKGSVSGVLASASADGANKFTTGLMWMASSCNNDVCPCPSLTNIIILMEDSKAAEGCVDPMLLLNVRDKLLDVTILDPPK